MTLTLGAALLAKRCDPIDEVKCSRPKKKLLSKVGRYNKMQSIITVRQAGAPTDRCQQLGRTVRRVVEADCPPVYKSFMLVVKFKKADERMAVCNENSNRLFCHE